MNFFNAAMDSGNSNGNPNNPNNPNNKMELSFKATLQFSDGHNKFEINPNINLHNQNIMNVNLGNNMRKSKLEKINER